MFVSLLVIVVTEKASDDDSIQITFSTPITGAVTPAADASAKAIHTAAGAQLLVAWEKRKERCEGRQCDAKCV